MVKITFTTPEGEVLTREYTKGDVRIKKWLDEGWEKVSSPKKVLKSKKKGKK